MGFTSRVDRAGESPPEVRGMCQHIQSMKVESLPYKMTLDEAILRNVNILRP